MTNDEAAALITTAVKTEVPPEKVEVSYFRRNGSGELLDVFINYEIGGKCHSLHGKFKHIAQTGRDKLRAYLAEKANKKAE